MSMERPPAGWKHATRFRARIGPCTNCTVRQFRLLSTNTERPASASCNGCGCPFPATGATARGWVSPACSPGPAGVSQAAARLGGTSRARAASSFRACRTAPAGPDAERVGLQVRKDQFPRTALAADGFRETAQGPTPTPARRSYRRLMLWRHPAAADPFRTRHSDILTPFCVLSEQTTGCGGPRDLCGAKTSLVGA